MQGVTKEFGSFRAVDNVSLEVPAGTVTGLLGPNGAGKTTCVRMLTTLLVPDSGEATIDGHAVGRHGHAARKKLGVSGQYAAVDDKLTGLENLTLVGQLYGMRHRRAKERAKELLEQFRLDTVPKKQRVGTYSGGMRRRIDLAGAIVARPPAVILDEPTTGLDPRGRRDTWNAIADLRSQGTAVLLTTQYLEEADQLADFIAVIDGGRIVADGTAAALKAQAGEARIDITFANSAAMQRAVSVLSRAHADIHADEQSLRISADASQGSQSLAQALASVREAGVDVVEAALRRPTLDEVFLRITGSRSEAEASQTVEQQVPA